MFRNNLQISVLQEWSSPKHTVGCCSFIPDGDALGCSGDALGRRKLGPQFLRWQTGRKENGVLLRKPTFSN